mgnify:CR=1 FL=1
MAGWRDLEARVDAVMTRAFSENVRVSFLKNGVIDPARPGPIDIAAILHTGGDDSYAAGSGTRVRLSAGQAELVIDRSTYTGSMPKVQDKVRASDRAGMPWFEVASVSDRYSNLLVLSLGAA